MPSLKGGWTSLPPIKRATETRPTEPTEARPAAASTSASPSEAARFEPSPSGRVDVPAPPATSERLFGGLHQLSTRGAAPDFAGYRPGKNNRALLGAVVRQLIADYGLFADHVYGAALAAGGSEARFGLNATRRNALYEDGVHPDGPAKIHIGEAELDELLAGVDAPGERRAVATFVLAHEYFHVYLGHRDLLEGRPVEGVSVPWSRELPLIAERQVDYLAARYLHARGLPLEPVAQLFTRHAGLAAGNASHPPGAERAALIQGARGSFDESLFKDARSDFTPRLSQLRYHEHEARLTAAPE